VWIALEWDAPPPLDVTLDWSRPLFEGSPRALVETAPAAVTATAVGAAPAGAPDATPAVGESRLPVATLIDPSAVAPVGPSPTRIATSHSGEAARVSGLRGLVSRLATALGLRRASAPDDAPRVASVGTGSGQ
jgi:hypothetical protein